MKVWSLLPLVAFLGMAFSGCVDPASLKSVEAPVWQSGYSYAYRTEGHFDFEGAANGERRTESEPIGPIFEIFEVLNTTLKAGDEPLYLAGQITRETPPPDPSSPESSCPNGPCANLGSTPGVSLIGYRARDLQVIPVSYSSSSACQAGICRYALENLEFGPAPEWTFLDFPLKRGKSWYFDLENTHEMAEETLDDFGEALQFGMRAKVVGPTRVSLPVGSVEAMRVDLELFPTNFNELRDAIHQEAREEGVKLEKFDLTFSYRMRVYYSEEYQTIVRVVTTVDNRFHIKGVDEGEKFDFFMHVRVGVESSLEGARLVQRPERDLDYVARILANKVPLGDPSGKAVVPVTYGIQVQGDKKVVNAALAESGTFQVKLVGIAELPKGHSVQVRMLDAGGDLVHKGTGLNFTHVFDEPGRFSIEAEALDENEQLVSYSATAIIANYDKKVLVDCGRVSAAALNALGPGCPSVPVPVRPGIQRLSVAAQTMGMLDALSDGRLQLTDAANRVTNTPYKAGGTYTIEMSDFKNSAIADKDWSLRMAHNRQVEQDVEYTVQLTYGSEKDVQAPVIRTGTLEFELPPPPGLPDWVRAALR